MNKQTRTVISLEAEIEILRHLLWLSHGHSEYWYGDDGEMQCKLCGLDFKRAPVVLIEKAIRDNGLYEAARLTMHEHGMPWTDPRTGLTHHPDGKVERL